MNLQQLYYFRTLAEVKHFTKAAIKLMVTQPSLSHSINDLEAELGVSLFDRSNRQVTMTKYGGLFLEYVNHSLNILDEGRAKLDDFIDPDQGTVALSYVSSLEAFVPYLVAQFYKLNQGIQIMFQFQQSSNAAIFESLFKGSIDLGMGTRCLSKEPLMTHKLGEHELVLLVSNDHPLAQEESVDLRQIRQEQFITYSRECDIRDYIDSIFKIIGITPRIVSETAHDTMIYSFVAANYGVALVPAPLGINHYHVKALHIQNEVPKREIYLMWKDVRYLSPAVSRFRDFIVENGQMLDSYRAEMIASKQDLTI
ncbi:putative LysR family transcriptional regulator [Oscillibacter valericigenes Sjm18-20]|nr:putative LysR family transcriptional regulator [Oscillibacter valericigenes Sjm18-20]